MEGCDDAVLRPATAALQAAGVYMVVAAGNTGPFCGSIHDPLAVYPDVLTVGAVDRDEQVTEFSSRGPVPGAGKPDLVAPGARVVSALPGGGYGPMDGTSMATPHVAGVVALVWSANPELIGDPAATTAILRDTARPVTIGDEDCGGPAELAGAGLVDAHAAVLAARG
jgi:subtilisin family serine protease